MCLFCLLNCEINEKKVAHENKLKSSKVAEKPSCIYKFVLVVISTQSNKMVAKNTVVGCFVK